MQAALWLSAAALLCGVVLGARSFLDPKWVRPKAQLEGAGLRALGAGVAAAHLAALYFVAHYLLSGHYLFGVIATGVIAPLAALWGGAALGWLSLALRGGAPVHWRLFAFCAALALAAGAPWPLWLLSR